MLPGTLTEARRIPLWAAARAIQAQSQSGRRSNDGASLGLWIMQMVRNRTYGAVGRKRQGRKKGVMHDGCREALKSENTSAAVSMT